MWYKRASARQRSPHCLLAAITEHWEWPLEGLFYRLPTPSLSFVILPLQCSSVCPVGAIIEHSEWRQVLDALENKTKVWFCCWQVAKLLTRRSLG